MRNNLNETYATFLTIVESIRTDLISSLDYLKSMHEPGAFQTLSSAILENNQHPEFNNYKVSLKLVRQSVDAVTKDYNGVAPGMIVSCTMARFGIGECGEHTIEFARRLLSYNISGKLVNIAINNPSDRSKNHMFLVYFPADINLNEHQPETHKSFVTWLERLPTGIINQGILIDPWRDLVFPLRNVIQRQKFLELMQQSKMDYLGGFSIQNLYPGVRNQGVLTHINAKINEFYRHAKFEQCRLMPSVHTQIPTFKLISSDTRQNVPNEVLALKRNWANPNAEKIVTHTSALGKLNHFSCLRFLGIRREDYTLDAIAGFQKEQFDNTAALANELGGEIYARNNRFLFLVKGINVSKAQARSDEPHALLDEIQKR